uniref:Uncharacterized protein n=1 Tax=Haptolina ericina TaxID=156174 RepID=A0A7S3ERQ9_9EUKA
MNDDKALSVLPGSHLERGCKLPCGKGGRGYLESPKGRFKKVKPVVLRPGVGDALLFDQRLIHRGQSFQGADQESRIAVQISFGLPNAFTYEFSEGARQRQRDQALSGKGSMPAGGLKLELRRACDAPSKAIHQQGADTLPKGVKPLHPRSFMCFPSVSWLGQEVYSLPAPQAQEPLLSATPPSFVWHPRRHSCAVVGPSGILRGSGCGARIDATRGLVIRSFSGREGMPIGGSWAGDVGRRVDVTLTNGKPKQRGKRLLSAGGRVAAWLNRYSVQTNVTVLLTDACGMTVGEEWRGNHRDTHAAPGLQALPLRNEYLNCVDQVWRRAAAPTAPIRWSSGVLLMSVALGLCESIDVYGFWPFDIDLAGKRVAYHYDDDPAARAAQRSKEGVHSNLHDWATEWSLLNATSGIRMHVGRCESQLASRVGSSQQARGST